MSILNTATRALQSTQLAIATTSHNIANVNTPGFRRQEAVFTTNTPLQSGSGFIGQGISVSTVRRVYSEFLERQVSQSEAQAGYLSQYLDGAKQIDNIFGDRSVGFSSAIQNFYASWNALANSPGSIPARQGVIGAANSLVTNMRGVGDYLQTMQDSVNADIGSLVAEVNTYARTIASLNDRIALAQTYDTLTPNDLLDQRDQAVSELNELIGATVVKDASTGAYNVFLGRGYQLVGVSGALPITAKRSGFDPLRTEVFGAGGGVQLSGDLGIIGGRLGGLLDFRSEMLDAAQNALGQIAISLAQNTNAQHQLGQDLNGVAGGLFFEDPSALAKVYRGNGTSMVAATISDASDLTNSDYRLTYDGTSYTLLRVSDGSTWTNASLATLSTSAAQGFSLSLASGTAAAGDSFLIRPTVAGATKIGIQISDPRKVAAGAPVVAAAASANTGSAQFTQPVVDRASQPPLNANLTNTVTITFDSATTFDVAGTGTGNPQNVAYTSGADISYNGWSFKISGTPAAGDTFTISLNSGGILDNRNALAIAAMQTDKTLVGGIATLESAYTTLVGSVGNKTNEISVNEEAQTNLLAQSRLSQQSVSGVNLDEEAANLIRFQQAYQAAAKLIQASNTIFDALLQI